MLVEAANQVAPVVSEARTLDRFIGPAQERLWSLARNLWWSWDHDCTSLFRDLNPTRWRELNQNPISMLSEMPLGEIERRATELVLHSRINYATAASRSICNADRTWGATTRACCGLGRWPIFRPSSALHESLPIYSGGLGVLAGDHIKSASDLDIPLIGIGLFYGQGYFLAAPGQDRMAARRVSADRRESAAHAAGHRRKRRAGGGGDSDPGGAIRAKVWRSRWAVAICCCWIPTWRECAGRSWN
jgi:glucan phosphorylase